jgi:hypothetical protein
LLGDGIVGRPAEGPSAAIAETFGSRLPVYQNSGAVPTWNLERHPMIVESFMRYLPKTLHDHEMSGARGRGAGDVEKLGAAVTSG